MGRKRACVALMVAAAGLVFGAPAAPVAAQQGAPVAAAPAAGNVASAWAASVWSAAQRDDHAALDRLLADIPAGVDPRGELVQSVSLLKKNIEARETKRAEAIKKASRELDAALAEKDGGDFAISQALKAAVELSMVTPAEQKAELMKEPRIRSLIQTADAAARKAELRGDWLSASELYYRLDLLLEEQGTYKNDVKRETQRLAMIRMYNPRRLWELRNERRNQEIAWNESHQTAQEGQTEEERTRARRPLPKYNPVGDDFREKLAGIDESMVQNAILRAFSKHVERTPMEAILRSGVEALRTLVTTEDLKETFPGIGDAAARDAFLKALAAEDERLARPGATAGAADLMAMLPRLLSANEQTVKLPKTALLHEFGNGAMAALDEFSGIIWPDEIRRFNRNTQARFKGVGIQIELDPMFNIRVVTPLEGTPAQRAGIRPGDLIKKVDGASTEGFTLDQAVDVITGPGDTKVTLTIEREITDENGEKKVVELEFPLVRKEIPVTTVKGWRKSGVREDDWDWYIDPASKIGYVRLTQFADKTDNELQRAIDQMEETGLSGLILDLRYNPGGLLDQAVAVTSRFIERTRAYNGMVVTTHTKNNELVQQERLMSGRARFGGVPVVVLINQGSASASEIVAGAIQDYAKVGQVKALVVGDRSYGKGSVQNVWQLPTRTDAEAAVKVTTQYYHLPAGRMIHRLPQSAEWGVKPDLTVEMLPSQMADALILRQNADVLKMDENGQLIKSEKEADPADLIEKGLDVQLHRALVILKAQAAAKAAADHALAERPAMHDGKPN